jgi:glucokinase
MTAVTQHYLVADIGGTHTRFAIACSDRSLSCLSTEENRDYRDLGHAVQHYLGRLPKGLNPGAAVFAVACPVKGDEIVFTNRGWNFSIREIRTRFSFQSLDVLNDFTAIAMAIPGLTEKDRLQIGEGKPVKDKPVGIIGPGTGLGVAILVPVKGKWIPVASEGGHVTLAGTNDEEDRIIALARGQLGHVSAERLLSGPGLTILYKCIARMEGTPDRDLEPPGITARDESGEDPTAVRTLDLFMNMLGTVAGNLAVTVGAEGGIYIAGGILPRIKERFSRSAFRQRFIDKGRFRDYLNRIPTYLITRENVALYGLEKYLIEKYHGTN